MSNNPFLLQEDVVFETKQSLKEVGLDLVDVAIGVQRIPHRNPISPVSPLIYRQVLAWVMVHPDPAQLFLQCVVADSANRYQQIAGIMNGKFRECAELFHASTRFDFLQSRFEEIIPFHIPSDSPLRPWLAFLMASAEVSFRDVVAHSAKEDEEAIIGIDAVLENEGISLSRLVEESNASQAEWVLYDYILRDPQLSLNLDQLINSGCKGATGPIADGMVRPIALKGGLAGLQHFGEIFQSAIEQGDEASMYVIVRRAFILDICP